MESNDLILIFAILCMAACFFWVKFARKRSYEEYKAKRPEPTGFTTHTYPDTPADNPLPANLIKIVGNIKISDQKHFD